MHEAIGEMAEYVALAVNVLAILAIAVGSIQGALGLAQHMLLRHAHAEELRPVWLAFGRWLLAGLTFQLGSDIVETAVAPGWEDIGKLAAIAVIRTFLSYFLDRDLEGLRDERKPGQLRGQEIPT